MIRALPIAMMGQLAELLRHSLRAPIAHEVPLRDEVSLLANYVGIMRARFGEALSVEVNVDPAVASAAVPSLLLQPLVENAIRHGVGPRGGGRIEVQARRNADWLELAVSDDGVGVADASAMISAGIGPQHDARPLFAALLRRVSRLLKPGTVPKAALRSWSASRFASRQRDYQTRQPSRC